MKLLLDTHAFLWWLEGDRQLSANAHSAINDDANDVVVSAATAWEIATKHRLGKLPQAEQVAQDVLGAIASQGFEEIDITVEEAQKAGRLPGLHGDPFDRMLIAQAMERNMALVSKDAEFDGYGVNRLW